MFLYVSNELFIYIFDFFIDPLKNNQIIFVIVPKNILLGFID